MSSMEDSCRKALRGHDSNVSVLGGINSAESTVVSSSASTGCMSRAVAPSLTRMPLGIGPFLLKFVLAIILVLSLYCRPVKPQPQRRRLQAVSGCAFALLPIAERHQKQLRPQCCY